MKNFVVNSKGFVSLSLVFILMTFLSLYMTAVFAIALSQQRDYVRSTCIQEATDIQSSALTNVRRLFAFNSTSTGLRFKIKTTKAALIVARMTAQVQAVAYLEVVLNTLYQSQKMLDTAQRVLITEAQVELQAKHLALIVKLNKGQQELVTPWRYMMNMTFLFTPRSAPTLAIRPDSEGGIGPNYEWKDKAEEEQALAYSWNMFFATRGTYQKFFAWSNVLSLTCEVSPRVGEKQWQLKINAGK